MERKKKSDVLFIVSKSGQKDPRLHFYKDGKSVPQDKISVRYRNSTTGRFVTQRYVRPVSHAVERIPNPTDSRSRYSVRGRDSSTGQFVPIREAKRYGETTIVERIAKDSPVYFNKNSSKRK